MIISIAYNIYNVIINTTPTIVYTVEVEPIIASITIYYIIYISSKLNTIAK